MTATALGARTASPGVRRGVLVLAGALYLTGTLGSNLAPAWIDERPGLIIAMSARNRNLLASVPFLDVVPYALIGFARIMLVGVVLWCVGALFGSKAVAWTEQQLGEMPAYYRWFQTGVDRAGWAFVLLMPGSNLVCLMAGHRRMRLGWFVPLLAVGAVLKLVVLRIAGDAFAEEIKDVLDVVDRYQWWIVGGLFAITFLQSARRAQKNPPSKMLEPGGEDDELVP